MTKQEKSSATKKAKLTYNHYFSLLKNQPLAFSCSLILINELIMNSENETLKYWQYVKERLFFFYYCA